MDIWLKIGTILFHFIFDRKVNIESQLEDYIVNPPFGCENICVKVTWDWSKAELPKGAKDGEDSIQEYYIENEFDFCLTKGGIKGPIACVCCSKDYKMLKCYINEGPFIYSPDSLGHILRFLPIRAIFQHNEVLFLHGSVISIGNKGIVFSGPSGIGKTTQSKLWESFAGATRLCNDRVLISHSNKQWNVHSFPIDGSEPVDGNCTEVLKCIVILNQATENNARHLRPAEAISKLIPQVVMDSWNSFSREKAMEQLVNIIEDIPIIEFNAMAEEAAVKYLHTALEEGGIL